VCLLFFFVILIITLGLLVSRWRVLWLRFFKSFRAKGEVNWLFFYSSHIIWILTLFLSRFIR